MSTKSERDAALDAMGRRGWSGRVAWATVRILDAIELGWRRIRRSRR